MNPLDPQTILDLFRNYYPLFIIGVFACAFLITFYLIPKVLWVTKEKKLMKPVIGRSAHTREIPSFGGVAFFITCILLFSMLQSIRPELTGNHLIAAMTLLFMVGLKDDLVVSTARVKFLGQIFAASFLVFSPELQITTLNGFWGIHEIPAALGYIIATFLIVALINAYNLIDGINGLAGIIGIVIATAYGIVFYIMENPYFVIICCILIGILAAFLRFNFSRSEKKIFMGDSGSLVIGLILGFLSLKILSMPLHIPTLESGYSPANRVLFVLAVLFIPIFDTARVMLLRISKGKSPFSADRNHAHHILLDLGMNHPKASMLLGSINLGVIILFVVMSNNFSNVWLSIILFSIYALCFALFKWIAPHDPVAKQIEILNAERKKKWSQKLKIHEVEQN